MGSRNGTDRTAARNESPVLVHYADPVRVFCLRPGREKDSCLIPGERQAHANGIRLTHIQGSNVLHFQAETDWAFL